MQLTGKGVNRRMLYTQITNKKNMLDILSYLENLMIKLCVFNFIRVGNVAVKRLLLSN